MIHTCEELLFNVNTSYYTAMHSGFLVDYINIDRPCCIYAMSDKRSKLTERINSIEYTLRKNRLAPCYRLVSHGDFQQLDSVLLRNGYEMSDQGSVEFIELEHLRRELFTFASFLQNGVYIEEQLLDVWLEDFMYLHQYNDDYYRVFKNNMTRSYSDFVYFSLVEEGRLIGEAYAAIDRDIMIIKDIVIQEEYRGLKYGHRLLMSMLSFALKQDCKSCIIEVNSRNTVAVRLLNSVGFRTLYQYWYRIKK